jgi:hypothetical protein
MVFDSYRQLAKFVEIAFQLRIVGQRVEDAILIERALRRPGQIVRVVQNWPPVSAASAFKPVL